jgi:hypothetical protein
MTDGVPTNLFLDVQLLPGAKYSCAAETASCNAPRTIEIPPTQITAQKVYH